MKITYISYQDKILEVQLTSSNPIAEVTFELEHETIRGETVMVTAQAAGQISAINQQIRANAVKNIIAAQRIQGIPEPNAAEAVGRLPGVSLQGAELVIRGLSPTYNQIRIDGVDIASTNQTNRSQSLGMISQYMLEGIEMTKTAMADNEGDVMGATVNLILKDAPAEPSFNFLFEDGYNDISSSFDNMKFVASGSNRFLDGKLGIFGSANYERSTGGTDRLSANYQVITQGVEISGMTLTDRDVSSERIGTSLVMDYKTGLSKFKASSFFSRSKTDREDRGLGFSFGGSMNLSLNLQEREMTVLTNNLRAEHYLRDWLLDDGISYSYSKNETPYEVELNGQDANGVQSTPDWQVHPIDVSSYSEFSMERAVANNFKYKPSSSISTKFSADLNIKKEFHWGNWLDINLKFGGKFKHQTKDRDVTDNWIRLSIAVFEEQRNKVIAAMDWLTPENTVASGWGDLAYLPFTDPNYSNNDLLLGDYVMETMPDPGKLRQVSKFLLEENLYLTDWQDQFRSDYNGFENYTAGYVLPEINFFGEKLTLIPAVRYRTQ